MTAFLIFYILVSAPGWIWVAMSVLTLRDLGRIRERERCRVSAKVVDLIPEKKVRRQSHGPRKTTRTVWHPVVEFTLDGKRYRIRSGQNLSRDDVAVGDEADILLDADDPAQFHFELAVEHDRRTARRFFVLGIAWAVGLSPLLVSRALNG